VGLMLATVLATGLNVNVLLTMVAGVALFLAREPLSQGVKLRFGRRRKPVPKALYFWAGVYLAISAAAGGLLLIWGGLWGLLWLAAAGVVVLAVHLTLAPRRQLMMTAWGEWIGVLGVSLVIPAIYLAANETLDQWALGLWLIGLAQVTGPIFYIRLKVRIQARLPEPPPMGQRLLAAWRPLLFSAISLAGAVALGMLGWAPAWAWLALLPSAIKHLWGALNWTPRGHLNIQQLGWIEVANILLFALILGAVYRIG
jgi:hypothetical protein